MQRLNRDSIVAMLLLVLCGVFFWATFDIREPDYGVLLPSTWPRVVIVFLTVLCFIYLIQSLYAGPAQSSEARDSAPPGFLGFIGYWRNPIICFCTFFLFLATLPVMGMLLGGISFVFILMTLLGGWAPRQLLLHAVLAVMTVGGMWSLFTYGLGVMLPVGLIYNPFAA